MHQTDRMPAKESGISMALEIREFDSPLLDKEERNTMANKFIITHVITHKKKERRDKNDIARQEHTYHLSRALNYAKKLGYQPQAVANDVLILSNSKI